MKKLLTKALLVTAGLYTGVNCVWAQDTETMTLLNIDYSTATTPAWTVIGGTGSIADGAWTHTHDGGSGARSAYLDFGLESSIDDNWSASFDITWSTGSTWTKSSDLQVAVTSASATYTNNVKATSNILLGARVATTESNMGTSLAYTITLNGVDEEEKVTLSHGTTYTFNVAVEGTSLIASIMNGTTTVYSGSATLSSFVKPRGIYDLLPRPYNSSWGVYSSKYDNIIVTKEVEAGAVEVPTASITAVDGINRTVTFACATEGVTFSYSTDGENFTTANSVVISENTTLYVKATKGTKSATSEGLVFEAGTAVTLNTPTWTKTGYSAGVSTVTLSSNQGSVLLSPTADIYYTINGGLEIKYTDAISVNDGEILTYYASAEGYTNSAEGSVTAVAPNSNPVLWTETYNGIVSANSNLSLGATVISTVNNTDFYNFYYNEGATMVSERLLTNNVPNSGNNYCMLRANGIYGIAGMNMAILDLKVGDYVTINGAYGNDKFEITGNTTDFSADNWNTVNGSSYSFTVKKAGTCRFTLTRYGYLQSITVRRGTVPVTIGEHGYATFSSTYDLDFSGTGVTPYIATASNNKSVTLTPMTKTPYNTGLVLKGAAGTYDIPVTTAYSNSDWPSGATNYLKYCLEETTVNKSSDGTNYVLSVQSDKVVFAPINEASATVGAGHAYLYIPNGNGTRALNISFGDEASGISTIEAETLKNTATFNLSGQRVSKPGKGLYIVNGKKVMK